MDAKQLAEEHWAYVKKVIMLHEQADSEINIDMIGFHYISAAIHFFGHGYEQCQKDLQSKKLMTLGEYDKAVCAACKGNKTPSVSDFDIEKLSSGEDMIQR